MLISSEISYSLDCGVHQRRDEKISKEISDFIEVELLKPVRELHQSVSFMGKFADAYTIKSVWKYVLYKKPSKKNKFYLFQLREYEGAFIVSQYNFRVYDKKKNKLVIEEIKDSEKFMAVKKWLQVYEEREKKEKESE